MRHAASLVAAMEGIGRPAFRIAKELASNSRTGLTVRFLSKKLDLPQEEIEYLVDINHRFLFTDLTKIKLVPEGFSAVKRIAEGLENRGDIASLYHLVKSLDAHEFRRFEEQIGIDRPGPKKFAMEQLVEQYYRHVDSIVTYVATRNFSDLAREVFDIVWQSDDGLVPISKIRAVCKENDYKVELALWELFRGFALFEMFRFDAEDRLVRVAGLLAEVRQYREATAQQKAKKAALKPLRFSPPDIEDHQLDFSDKICRVVAAIAARPARLRGDGEMFREDMRRVEEICPEGTEPSLNTCLWAAEGVGWLARVDGELRAGELRSLLDTDRLSRHRILYEWFVNTENEARSRQMLVDLLEEIKPRAWYSTIDFIKHATRLSADIEEPVLRAVGGHWQYINPSATKNSESALGRSLEETLLWLGVVARGEQDGESVFSLTELGECLLTGRNQEQVAARYPRREAEIIVQPNFDIVVPTQDMDPLLTVPLDQFAVRGSTGQATVYNVTKDSFTQAIQEGHDGEAFVDFLIAHNRGGSLPANVMTTLDDWRGGMKRVRLRTIHILESDDPLVLADLLHRRRFRKYILPIDPNKSVRYTKIPKVELAKALEKDGFIVE